MASSTVVEYEFGGPLGATAITIGLPLLLTFFAFGCNDVSGCPVPSLLSPRTFTWEKWAAETGWPEGGIRALFDWKVTVAVLAYYVFVLLLWRLLPAQKVHGTKLVHHGRPLEYRMNAFSTSVAVFAACAIGTYLQGAEFPVWTYIVDHYVQILTANVLVSFALATYLYISSFSVDTKYPNKDLRELAAGGRTDNIIYDFYIGRELNPRVTLPLFGEIDIKTWCEMYPGLTGWILLDLAFVAKQYRNFGYVSDSILLITFFQGFYVLNSHYNELGLLTMMDITTDGMGFMLSFGDLVWVPFLYSTQCRYLSVYPLQLGWLNIAVVSAVFALGLYIFRAANDQKHMFRTHPNDPSVAGLSYIQTQRGTRLLTAGWWGMSRHINYFGDWLQALPFSLPTGMAGYLIYPAGSIVAASQSFQMIDGRKVVQGEAQGWGIIFTYFYVLYFAILLMHRERRDDAMSPKHTFRRGFTMKMADFVCPSDTFQACPPHLRATFSQEDRFRFTPVKATRAAPRPWERKPSTAFRARGKSRKVWKRFRTSFNSMKALQQLIAAERHTVDDDLHLEINTSRNPGLRRGVKRRCFALEADALEDSVRGRSFLETQWESEIIQLDGLTTPGKLPLIYSDFVDIPDEPVENDSLQPEESCDDVKDDQEVPTSTLEEELAENPANMDESPSLIPETPTKLASDAAYSRSLHGLSPLVVGGMVFGTPDLRTREDVEQPTVHLSDAIEDEPTTPQDDGHDEDTVSTMIGEEHTDEEPTVPVDVETLDEPAAATVAAPVQELTSAQESTLVRSALRSSLDGEDTELLNNFLSKAKAKREAKAAMVAQEQEQEQETDKTEPEPEVPVIVASPTPARRALEDLDTNSPSPQKPQLSPTKEKDEASPQPSSPRRSTRPRTVRSSNLLTTITAAAAVRNTLSLRRAKGTEFVFLQRTEAQELALTTRRNTRLNKGNAQAPKFVLQGLTRKSPASGKKADTAPCTDSETTGDVSERPRKTAKKHVSWNDEELVQFDDGSEAAKGDEHDVASRGSKGKSPEKRKAASSRTTRSQVAQKSGGEDRADAAATAPATATPRTRRVRRLGPGAPKADSTAATAVSNVSLSSPSSPTSDNSASTAEQRKKLTPKSPRRVPATPSKPASDSIKTSLRSSSAKTNLLKINAGSTPVPRKMRPRA
ncbi:C-14 sterol reductase [Aspergillus piperis CBS 112811]|uniref:Delta(14)-sterol reductase n=1 Tax=Aspergillus piperis CBS 112811 TaxID=1448313 RepID=A0A8G1RF53_9EURO|nr:C-14 sterol reductase [Aspergillus piperis CBS 112811]RAH62170.1 C-14 sterol reductase [Aspergillus piperis CBS 112811]